jgi:hypothetical protein
VQVHLLNSEHNPDIMLLAARALTFLADVLPSSCSSIVRHGAVPAFCARLLTIEYIDLAEQSLQVQTPAFPLPPRAPVWRCIIQAALEPVHELGMQTVSGCTCLSNLMLLLGCA